MSNWDIEIFLPFIQKPQAVFGVWLFCFLKGIITWVEIG